MLKIANDFQEAVKLGMEIAEEKSDIYTEKTLRNMMERVRFHVPDAEEQRKKDFLYAAVYDWNAYGATVDEEFAYELYEKSHANKAEYLLSRSRFIYVSHLNGGGNQSIIDKLENKWLLYQRLKKYYKREIIHVCSEADYSKFETFVKNNEKYVVKPLDCSCGVGVHLDQLENYNSTESAFRRLLLEGIGLANKHPTRGVEMIVEELIDQDEAMALLHPQSVNALRITTVRRADGKMVMYRPRIKIGMNGEFLASAAQNGVIAEIDPETGVIRTDGFNESGGHYIVHPNSGITLKGFQIPKWDELLELVDALNREMHEFGYIGWDIVLSKRGWCVMEGNYSGELASQVILGHGLRREFEELIGWKPEIEFWERYPQMYLY